MAELIVITEVCFYEPGDVPECAEVLDDGAARTWRAHHQRQIAEGFGYRDGWIDQLGPTDERTVAAKVTRSLLQKSYPVCTQSYS